MSKRVEAIKALIQDGYSIINVEDIQITFGGNGDNSTLDNKVIHIGTYHRVTLSTGNPTPKHRMEFYSTFDVTSLELELFKEYK